MSRPSSSSVLSNVVKPARLRAVCKCASLPSLFLPSTRTLSTSNRHRERNELYGNQGRDLRTERRWESTPPRMMAPVRSKPPVFNNDFKVNKDPARLDEVYNRIFGQGGDQMLTEEVKWLAVTHKSFDHGRRGYNDRLSYLGKRIVELQTSLALVHKAATTPSPPIADEYGRQPFIHPALQGIDGLTENAKAMVPKKERLAQLGERYGLDRVLRWKPRRMDRLRESGLPIVMAQSLYAIVGAVALQRGGVVANKVVRERILNPLGLQLE